MVNDLIANDGIKYGRKAVSLKCYKKDDP